MFNFPGPKWKIIVVLNLIAPNKTNQCPVDKSEDKDYYHVTPLSKKHTYAFHIFGNTDKSKEQKGKVQYQLSMNKSVWYIWPQKCNNLMFNSIPSEFTEIFHSFKKNAF